MIRATSSAAAESPGDRLARTQSAAAAGLRAAGGAAPALMYRSVIRDLPAAAGGGATPGRPARDR